MEKDAVIQRCFFFAVVVIATAMLFSCQNKSKQPDSCENMPAFEKRFTEKTVVTSAGDAAFTFSSMEEAEWKMAHGCFENICFWEAFEQVLMLEPSSMCYPFDTLRKHEEIVIMDSEDGLVRCYGYREGSALPYLLVQYKVGDNVKLAGTEGCECENGCYCVLPEKLYCFEEKGIHYYLVWGFCGYMGGIFSHSLCAFKLDETGLSLAYIFSLNDELDNFQSVDLEFCDAEIMDDTSFGYFDKKTLTFYNPEVIGGLEEVDGCYSNNARLTDRYYKLVWNGNSFVYESDKSVPNPFLCEALSNYTCLEKIAEMGKHKIRVDQMPNGTYRYASWNKNTPWSSTPELIVTNGTFDKTTEQYVFHNKEYEYRVGDVDLIVLKNGKQIAKYEYVIDDKCF
ncbi:MAG: hypothetical protein IKZ54_10430 [Bacteroidales bacterium]|nr:hypothetical protein [Bacteroidales bacterium]